MDKFSNDLMIRMLLHPEVLDVMSRFNMDLSDKKLYDLVLASMIRGITVFIKEMRSGN